MIFVLFDSHCHLDLYQYDEIAQIVSRCRCLSINFLHTIAVCLENHDALVKICNSNPGVYCSVGVHPNNVLENKSNLFDQIIKLASDKCVISIGETGLDYHYNKTPKLDQHEAFISHIKAAKCLGLPLVVHSRNAEEDTISILESEIKNYEIPVILHSFASSDLLFEAALKNDWYVSFSGIVTFKNAKHVADIAKKVPNNRILVETDAPYLAPVPKRGKTNYPDFILYTIDFLKKLRLQQNLDEIMMQNFFRVFSKIPRVNL